MKYVVVGNSDYSVMVSRYFNNSGVSIDGYTVADEFITDKSINGIPIVPTEEIIRLYPPDSCKLIMGIGYRNMNGIKKKEYIRYKGMGYEFINYIHPSAIIEKDVCLGEGNNIFEGVIIQSGVEIGDANLIYGGVMIAHDCKLGNFNSLSVKACIAGRTVVGDNCFVGANATIRDHVCIADYTLVGAGAYVKASTRESEVVVAPKAVSLSDRNSMEFI